MTPGTLVQFGYFEAIALMGAVVAAAVVVVIRQLTRTETSATIFASQCIYALLLAVPMAARSFVMPSWTDAALLTIAALCATGGQLSMTEGFRFLPVAAGSAYQTLVPLIITLTSISLFAEPFTTPQIIGGALVLWGSFQTVISGHRRARPQPLPQK